MTRHRRDSVFSSEKGVALIYMAVILTGLLLFTGLAIDSGRAYVVKAQLTKAVDGAALGAARHLNSGDPRGEATRIFKANFVPGFMGTSLTPDPTADPGFFALRTDDVKGVNIITITASAVLPTTFMKLGNFNQVTVGSLGEATRRMVDSVPRARRVQLDRVEVACGPRCRRQLHRCVRRKPRSRLAAHVRERSERDRSHVLVSRVCEDHGHG